MTKDEILSRSLSDISDEFDKGVGSFFYDVTNAVFHWISDHDALLSNVHKVLKADGFL